MSSNGANEPTPEAGNGSPLGVHPIVNHDPSEFVSTQGKQYSLPGRLGRTSIEVLPLLKGRPWDAVALAYVHALRPSYIRVVCGEETCDGICWRVSVYVDDGVITKITQEVEVALPEGVKHGHALAHALQYGLESEQVAWHRDAKGYFVDGINGGYYKQTGDGLIPFPSGETRSD